MIPFRRCPKAAALSDPGYQWPRGKTVVWYFAPSPLPPGLDCPTAEAAAQAGWSHWSHTCGVPIVQTIAPNRPDAPPDVVCRFLSAAAFEAACMAQGLDPGEVLALTDEPADPRPGTQLVMRLHLDWDWSPALLENTVWHEAGHALGLQHSPEGVPDVMEPWLEPRPPAIGPYSGPAAVARYGPPIPPATGPAPTPSAPSNPPEPAGTSWQFTVADAGAVTIPELAPGTYQLTLIATP